MLSGTPVQCREQLWCFTELWSSCSVCRWLLHRNNSEIPEWERKRRVQKKPLQVRMDKSVHSEKGLLWQIEIHALNLSKACIRVFQNTDIHVSFHTDVLAPGPGKMFPSDLPNCIIISHSLTLQSLSTGDSDPHRPLKTSQGHIPMLLSPSRRLAVSTFYVCPTSCANTICVHYPYHFSNPIFVPNLILKIGDLPNSFFFALLTTVFDCFK